MGRSGAGTRGRGKTIETWEHPTYAVKLPIIMTPEKTFRAEYNNGTFEFDSLKDLYEKLKTEVEECNRLEWVRVLVVESRSTTFGTSETADSGKGSIDLDFKRFWLAKRLDGSWMMSSVWHSVDDGKCEFDHENGNEIGGALPRLLNSRVWTPPGNAETFALPYKVRGARSVFSNDRVYLPYAQELWDALVVISEKLRELAFRIDSLVQTDEGRAQLINLTAGLLLPALTAGE